MADLKSKLEAAKKARQAYEEEGGANPWGLLGKGFSWLDEQARAMVPQALINGVSIPGDMTLMARLYGKSYPELDNAPNFSRLMMIAKNGFDPRIDQTKMAHDQFLSSEWTADKVNQLLGADPKSPDRPFYVPDPNEPGFVPRMIAGFGPNPRMPNVQMPAMFVGTNGLKKIPAALELAKDMWAKGATRDEIWEATGKQFNQPWMQMYPRGDWVFETTDTIIPKQSSKAQVLRDKPDTVGKAVEYREFEENFPGQLDKIAFNITKNNAPLPEREGGFFQHPNAWDKDGRVQVGDINYMRSPEAVKSIFAHEVGGHAGQAMAGLPTGNSTAHPEVKLEGAQIEQQFRQAIQPHVAFLQQIARGNGVSIKPDDSIADVTNRILSTVKDPGVKRLAQHHADQLLIKQQDMMPYRPADEAYRRVAGEFWARMTDERKNMTMEERIALKPWEHAQQIGEVEQHKLWNPVSSQLRGPAFKSPQEPLVPSNPTIGGEEFDLEIPPASYGGGNGPAKRVRVLKNPSYTDVQRLRATVKVPDGGYERWDEDKWTPTQEPIFRTMRDSDGNLYVWNGEDAIHSPVAVALDAKFGDFNKLPVYTQRNLSTLDELDLPGKPQHKTPAPRSDAIRLVRDDEQWTPRAATWEKELRDAMQGEPKDPAAVDFLTNFNGNGIGQETQYIAEMIRATGGTVDPSIIGAAAKKLTAKYFTPGTTEYKLNLRNVEEALVPWLKDREGITLVDRRDTIQMLEAAGGNEGSMEKRAAAIRQRADELRNKQRYNIPESVVAEAIERAQRLPEFATTHPKHFPTYPQKLDDVAPFTPDPAIIETPEFKRFFEGSQAVDESGKPLLLFHGPAEDGITVFRGDRGANYFTPDKRTAEGFAGYDFSSNDGVTRRPELIPAYLSLKNPFIAHMSEGGMSSYLNKGRVAQLKKRGYDGVIGYIDGYGNTPEYAVFNSKQIKHVNNRGTFDPENPNIYESRPLEPSNPLMSESTQLQPSNPTMGGLLGKPLLGSDKPTDIPQATNVAPVSTLPQARGANAADPFFGAPAGIRNAEARRERINRYKAAMLHGLPAMNWYPEESERILEMVGGGVNRADKVAGSIAPTSANTKLQTNAQTGPRGYYQGMAGNPIDTATGAMNRAIQRVFNGDPGDLGPKINPFFHHLRSKWGGAPPRGVHDTWDAQLWGYSADEAIGAPQHRWMDDALNEAIAEANAEGLGGRTDWDYGNSQASAWASAIATEKGITPEELARGYQQYYPDTVGHISVETQPAPNLKHPLDKLGQAGKEAWARLMANITHDDKGHSTIAQQAGLLTPQDMPSYIGAGYWKNPTTGKVETNPVIRDPVIFSLAKGAKEMEGSVKQIAEMVAGEMMMLFGQAQVGGDLSRMNNIPLLEANAVRGILGRDLTGADLDVITKALEAKGFKGVYAVPENNNRGLKIVFDRDASLTKPSERSKEGKAIMTAGKETIEGLLGGTAQPEPTLSSGFLVGESGEFKPSAAMKPMTIPRIREYLDMKHMGEKGWADSVLKAMKQVGGEWDSVWVKTLEILRDRGLDGVDEAVRTKVLPAAVIGMLGMQMMGQSTDESAPDA